MWIDWTVFPIYDPRTFSSEWYSYNINRACVRYEVGRTVDGIKIVCTNGPYDPGEHMT